MGAGLGGALDGCPCGTVLPAGSPALANGQTKGAASSILKRTIVVGDGEAQDLGSPTLGLPAAAQSSKTQLSNLTVMNQALEDATGLRVPAPAQEAIEDVTTRAKQAADVAMKFVQIGGTVEVQEWEDDIETDGQNHVFTFQGEISQEETELLSASLEPFPDNLLEDNFHSAVEQRHDQSSQAANSLPPTELLWGSQGQPKIPEGASCTTVDNVSNRLVESWRDAGLDMIQEGLVGIVILAGGDCGRYRMSDGIFFDGVPPTGTLNFGLLSHKTMFQLFCERIQRLEHVAFRRRIKNIDYIIETDNKLAKRKGWVNNSSYAQYPKMKNLALYIMVNEENRAHTIDFFKKNEWFGMDPKNIMIFAQSNYPLTNSKGKLLLESKHQLILKPAGSGAVFSALRDNGVVPDMKSRGIKYVYMMPGDNILARVGDPLFMGHFETIRVPVGLKVVERTDPSDHYGLFVTRTEERVEDEDNDGDLDFSLVARPAMKEFYMTDERFRTRRRMDKKRFVYFAGSLAQYYFTVDAVEKAANHHTTAWHALYYWVPFFSVHRREMVKPPRTVPNACRLETLVSDTFDHHKKVTSLCVHQHEEYAVIRSPIDAFLAVASLSLLHQSWITAVGGRFAKKLVAGLGHDQRCEVSPLVSYSGEGLESCFKELHLPYHLSSVAHDIAPNKEGANLADVKFRNTPLKFLPWNSVSEENLLAPPKKRLSVVEREQAQANHKTHQQKEAYEKADYDERLPPTPRDLHEAEEDWKEIMDKKMAEHYRRQKELEESDEQAQRNNLEKLAKQLEQEKVKEAERKAKELQEGREPKHQHHGHEDAGGSKRNRTIPFRPDKDEHDHDDSAPIIYGTRHYFHDTTRSAKSMRASVDDQSPRSDKSAESLGTVTTKSKNSSPKHPKHRSPRSP